ncbi:HNH endonuclease signature motif containing protein, partial [Nocardiopsis sp. B62]|uniref:HNH endonuclease signature motif containing protein n=1 Tax=Nocardiopsis sp. B62 TaxID=2824874 RepID=UPI0024958F14
MTFSFAHHTVMAGRSPAVTAMRHAREQVTHALAEVPPAGAVAGVLDEICHLWQDMDQATLAILLRLAQIQATGNLLEVGGQRTLAGWITQALGTSAAQARSLACLAQALFNEELPHTRTALDAGVLSLGEAAATAKAVEAATTTRDKNQFPDADEFRVLMDSGLMAAKADQPTLSAAQLTQLGKRVSTQLHPTLVQDEYKKAFDARRLDVVRSFEGSFYLQAWGPEVDAELLEKAVGAFTKPPNPTGPEQSKAERSYDAFMHLVKAALGHQGCTKPPGPLAMINVTVPLDVYTGHHTTTPTPVSGGGEGAAATQDGMVLAMEAVHAMAPNSVLRRVITDPATGKPLDVGRGMRNAPEQIRTVAHHGRTTCAWPQGCDVPISATEADHITSYSQGGHTSAGNIQPLCSTHNRLKWRRENNPHRAAWKGRPTHKPPNPPPKPEPPPPPEP